MAFHVALVAGLILFGCGRPAPIVIGYTEVSNRNTGQALAYYANQTDRRSEGRIRIEPRGFSEADGAALLDMIDSGKISGALIPVSALATRVPSISFLTTPYLFRDSDHLRKTLEGSIGTEILLEITAKTDLMSITFVPTGFHAIVTRDSSLTTPLRMEGKKAGIENPYTDQAFAEALGLEVAAIPPEKAVEALSSGAIDLYLGDPSPFLLNAATDEETVLLPTEYVADPLALVVSSAFWNGLSIEDRIIVRDAKAAFRDGPESSPRQRTDEPALRTMRIDKKPFVARSARLREIHEGDRTSGILDRIIGIE